MKPFFSIALLATLAIAGCKKKVVTPIKPEITQNIPYEEVISIKEAFKALPVLPPQGTVFPAPGYLIPFPPKGYPTNYQSYLTQYNVTVDMVKKAEITEMSIEVLSPTTQKLNFLDSPRIYMYTKEKPSPVLVAYKLPVPPNNTKVIMDQVAMDYKPYFITDSLFMKMTAYLTSIPDTNTMFKIRTNMKLTLSAQ